MNRILLRTDPGRSQLRKGMLMAVGFASLVRLIHQMEGLGTPFAPDVPGGWRFLETFFIWMFLMTGLLTSKAWVRTPRYTMGLPLSARTLWRTRVAAMTLGMCATLVLAYLAATLRWSNGPALDAAGWISFPQSLGLGLWMLAAVLWPEPRLRALRVEPAMVILVGFQWLALYVMSSALPRSPITGAVVMGLALLALWGIERQLAGAFDLELQEPDRRAPEAAAPATTAEIVAPTPSEAPTSVRPARRPGEHRSPSRLLVWRTAFRVMHDHWIGWFFPLVLLIYGLVVVDNYYEGDDNLFYGAYSIAFLIGIVNQGLSRLHVLDALPIPRRPLFVLCVLPGVVAFSLGMGLSSLGQENKALVMNRPGNVDVPHEFKGLAPDGIVPETVAPWGESYTPAGHPVWPGSSARLYRPFEYGEENSARFIAWLTDRAVAAVHGASDAPRGRMDVADLDAEWEERRRAHRFGVELSRGRPSPERSRTMAALAIFALAVGTGLELLAMTIFHPRWTTTRRKRTAWLGMGIPIGVAILIGLAELTGWSTMWAVTAAPFIRLREWTMQIGGDPARWWAGAAAVALLGGWIVMERFVKLEASLEQERKKAGEDF